MKDLRTRFAARAPRMLILAAAVLASGCASSGRPIVSREEGAGTDVQITVENQNFKDATIYAVWGTGPRDMLGMVTGNTTQTFTTPSRIGDLRVRVDLIAGDDVVSESMGVFEGDHIHVTIPPSAD